MDNLVLKPKEVCDASLAAQEAKSKTPVLKLFVLAVMAGMFIACGAAASNVAMHNISNVGLSRLAGAVIFPVGLMLIVFVGGELFTGDCLMILGVMDNKFNVFRMLKVLCIVWLGNLAGSVLVAAIVNLSGQLDYSSGLLGAFTIKVAYAKCTSSFLKIFCSGILCNVFVCCAVLMATASKTMSGKIWGMFFPIMAFVVSGYEHCVANMYYIPAGIMALSSDSYVNAAINAYGYSDSSLANLNISAMFVNNLLPATLGNMVGGMLFTGVLLYITTKKFQRNFQ